MTPITMPVLAVGLTTYEALEYLGIFSYGSKLPESVRTVLQDFDDLRTESRSAKQKAVLVVSAVTAIFLVIALAQHWAAVGLIGLTVIVLLTAFNGIIEEHH